MPIFFTVLFVASFLLFLRLSRDSLESSPSRFFGSIIAAVIFVCIAGAIYSAAIIEYGPK